MTATELLADLSRRGVRVWAEGDRLRYRAPAGVLSAGLRTALTERKAEVLAVLRGADPVPAASSDPALPLAPVPWDRASLPISLAQQRLWFLDQLEPGTPAYNLPVALGIAGRLDLEVLERTLNEIIRRHEALRTSFPTLEGRPVQQIAPALTIPLPVVDLRRLPGAERQVEAQRLAEEQAQFSFDLARGPLLRASLQRLADAEHVLRLTIHHIVADGWSVGVLAREIAAIYAALSRGESGGLPDLPIQYADFAVWQRAWLRGDVLEDQRAYWQRQLAGVSTLDLPTDRPHPATQSFRGATRALELPRSLTEAVKAFSQREGATLFMTLLATFQTLLHRYTGQDDIVVGSPIAGRTRPEVEGLIGFFVNSLVLRTDLSGDTTFRELLGRVREVCLGAYAHQDLPFEKLVEDMHVERDPSRNPVFQVAFALQPRPVEALEAAGLILRPLPFESAMTRFDLEFHLWEGADGLGGLLVYSTDLFDADTIARLVGHYRTLLAGAVAEPGRRLSELPLLTAPEQRQLLVEWNATRAEYPRDRCAHQLVEAQAARAPDALAVARGGERLSYGELNGRANQVAYYLRGLGVGPETVVGLCLDRSPDLAVGALGVLKAGGAYLPLDPAYPPERLAFMLQDARAPVLLTLEGLAAGLPDHAARVVCLNADWPAIARRSADDPPCAVTPDHLAYVIYTSGSTGRAKGVQIPHRGLLNLIFWHLEAFGVSAGDRATQVAGPAFDASVWELWPYLVRGASLHLPDEETRTSPGRLRDWLVEEGISVSFLPTPLAEWVLALDWPRATPLRTLLTGGDRLHVSPEPSHPFALVNNYGPTEYSVVTTSCPVPAHES